MYIFKNNIVKDYKKLEYILLLPYMCIHILYDMIYPLMRYKEKIIGNIINSIIIFITLVVFALKARKIIKNKNTNKIIAWGGKNDFRK